MGASDEAPQPRWVKASERGSILVAKLKTLKPCSTEHSLSLRLLGNPSLTSSVLLGVSSRLNSPSPQDSPTVGPFASSLLIRPLQPSLPLS